MKHQPIPVAVFGSGFIGLDLVIKIIKSPYLHCNIIFCRTRTEYLEQLAEKNNIQLVSDFPSGFEVHRDKYDIIFDATSAHSHTQYAPFFQQLNKTIINLTPADLGAPCIPSINLDELLGKKTKHFSMISCGGQAGIPLAHAIYQAHPASIKYLEIVGSMSSDSVGPSTRFNIDEYVETTEDGIKKFLSKDLKCKVLAVMNPANPPIDMRVSVFARIEKPDLEAITNAVHKTVEKVQQGVPYYKIKVEPWFNTHHVMVMTEIRGSGDFLPKYAGNLDIINCAAIATAERVAVENRS